MSNEKKQAAIYACSATGDQAALTLQVDQCKDSAEENGYTIDGLHISQDACNSSAKPLKRPQFVQLFVAASREEFATVLVTGFDRLSRDHWDMTPLEYLDVEVFETDW